MDADAPTLHGAWALGCVDEARLPGSPWWAMQERLELVAASWLIRSGGTGMSKLQLRSRYEDGNRRPWAMIAHGGGLTLSASAGADVPHEVADLVDSLVLLVATEANERDGRPPPAVLDGAADAALAAAPDGLPTPHARLEASLQILGDSFARAHFPAVDRRPHLLEPPYLTRAAATRLRAGVRAQLRALMTAELRPATEAARAGVEAEYASAEAQPQTVASRKALACRAVEYRAHVAALASEALASEVRCGLDGHAAAERPVGPSEGPSAAHATAQRSASRVALGEGIASLLARRGGELDARVLEPLRATAAALPAGLRRIAWRGVLLGSAARAARERGGAVAGAADLVRRTSARIGRNASLSGARSTVEAPVRVLLRAAVRSAVGAPELWAPARADGAATERALRVLHARCLEVLSADYFAGPDPLDAGAPDGGALAPQPLASADGALLAAAVPLLVYAWRDVADADARAELGTVVAMLRELRSERALRGVGTLASAARAVADVARERPSHFEDLMWLAMRSGAAAASGAARGVEPPPVRTAAEAASLLAATIGGEWLMRGFCAALPAEAAAWACDQCVLRATEQEGADWPFLLTVARVVLIGASNAVRDARDARAGWPALRALLLRPQTQWTAARLRAACFPELARGDSRARAAGGGSGAGGGVPRLRLAQLGEARARAEQTAASADDAAAMAAERAALDEALSHLGKPRRGAAQPLAQSAPQASGDERPRPPSGHARSSDRASEAQGEGLLCNDRAPAQASSQMAASVRAAATDSARTGTARSERAGIEPSARGGSRSATPPSSARANPLSRLLGRGT
ncbi:hypothetical protein KFE25_006796 [Diacronema lutheri]|uniref:Uncharacterized protein n=1 Tax=Diacronema lutheri TaxID=2081491 RepID=A0A8J5XPL9_DIALT|nr:hypothetical protein KFE25_006796 [Diacronema lutheri]